VDAGMLYLPRLFVYMSMPQPAPCSRNLQGDGAPAAQAIINPAMIATWLLGLWLIWLMERTLFSRPAGCKPNSLWYRDVRAARFLGPLGQGLRRRPQPAHG